MRGPLYGRTVLITGAARGIGAETARVAAARGARIAAVGLEPERLVALTTDLDATAPSPAGPHTWAECDVTDQSTVDNAVARTMDTHGRIDVVLANAGIASLGTVAVSGADAMVRSVDVNLNGVVRTAAATLPHLRDSHGYLLMVSSAAAFTVLPGMAAYCASKAGVEAFGTVLRMECAASGVAVGTAHPIWIDTDLVRDVQADLPSFRETLGRLPWPLNKVVPVRQCADALVRAMERRNRRVYVPRALGVVQSLRTFYCGPLAEAVLKTGADRMRRMESEVRALDRRFGAHSAGYGKPES
jgi:NAD(P)-dependent dehydrogenase (short-subunit alcohol dehydrogenase family)